MAKIDLHMHTTASDGTLTPSEVVQLSNELGLKIISITDHDSMNGVKEAIDEAKKYGITVIPGIEISTGYKGKDTHLLGYGLDVDNPLLKPVFDYVQLDRKNRNLKIAKKMEEDGIYIDLGMVFSKPIFGRPHFAKILVEQGYASSISDAFDRYLGNGCKYNIPRSYIPIEKAIQIIHECGGISILAHPFQYNYENIESFLDDVKNMGVDGIEVFYTGYSNEQIDFLLKYAHRNQLLVTGGSDFHGSHKPNIQLGDVEVKCEDFLKRFE